MGNIINFDEQIKEYLSAISLMFDEGETFLGLSEEIPLMFKGLKKIHEDKLKDEQDYADRLLRRLYCDECDFLIGDEQKVYCDRCVEKIKDENK